MYLIYYYILVCFYVFDQDKHGFFDTEELKLLMNILHGVKTGDTVKGNTKTAWQHLRFSDDDRVAFDELTSYHNSFPRLFSPAFKLQVNMQRFVFGTKWWLNRAHKLQDLRNEKKKKEAKRVEREGKKGIFMDF